MRAAPCSVIVEMLLCTNAAEQRNKQNTYEALMYSVAIWNRPESFAAYRKSPTSVKVMANATSQTDGDRAASPNNNVASEKRTIALMASVAP
jgi:hypothetical protein